MACVHIQTRAPSIIQIQKFQKQKTTRQPITPITPHFPLIPRTPETLANSRTSIGLGALPLDMMSPEIFSEISDANLAAALKQGRRFYLGTCSSCHVTPDIKQYTKKKWQKINHRMAKKSKLSPLETQALNRYIWAAHDFLASPKALKN